MYGAQGNFVLHRLIFQKEFPTLLKVFKGMKGAMTSQILDQVDSQGNTPLLLAGKLAHGDADYLKCVNFLFRSGADGKIRDRNGWSLMDEAISQQNTRLLAIVFNCLNAKKKDKIERNKLRVLSRLDSVPDFYTEVHWECSSTWIPFLSKIAPSDTFQIWKIGSSIRVDFSLVGFSKLQTKRRRMRILFRDGKYALDEYKQIDTLMIN